MNKTTANILVIEDEEDIRELLSIQLSIAGHSVETAANGIDALKMIQEKPTGFHLYIIDRMLPGITGIELCQKIRSNPETAHLPILMVTALTQSENIIEGLDAGADDYVTKPFDMNVLLARVRAQLREVGQNTNSTETNADQLGFGPLKIDTNKCRVTFNGEEIVLTSTEFRILSIMAQKPGHVFTRKQMIELIQGESVFVTNRTIDTHIAGLRKKLGEAASFVETIRGIGYRFKDHE